MQWIKIDEPNIPNSKTEHGYYVVLTNNLPKIVYFEFRDWNSQWHMPRFLRIITIIMQWIDVDDDRPSDEEIVLVVDKFNDFVTLGKYYEDDQGGYFDLMCIEKVEVDSQVTHWMSLPKIILDD